MPLADPLLAHKRPRLGLYAPFIALVVFASGWSLAWLWVRGEAERRMDAAAASVSSAGDQLSWRARRFFGFPFRLDVDLADARFAAASGWAISAPILKGEAFVFAPGHWVVSAPAGVVVTRPRGGSVIVASKVLRASVSEITAHPPRISIEGIGLTITPAPGASPSFLTSAGELHLHTRAGPGDQGAIFVEVDQAQARLSGLLGRIAGGKPVGFTGEGVFTHASALEGKNWPAAVRAWSGAGGVLNVRRILASAGQVQAQTRSGVLSVGDDGRLRGSLTATLRQAPRALAAMGQSGAISPEAAGAAASVLGARSRGDIATVTIDFQAGETTFGPAAIGPAPKVY